MLSLLLTLVKLENLVWFKRYSCLFPGNYIPVRPKAKFQTINEIGKLIEKRNPIRLKKFQEYLTVSFAYSFYVFQRSLHHYIQLLKMGPAHQLFLSESQTGLSIMFLLYLESNQLHLKTCRKLVKFYACPNSYIVAFFHC